MMGHARRTALGISLFAVLLLDFGCTGTDELVSESGNLSVEVVISPVGAGRYEQALITLTQITVRPTDPVADATLGAVPIGMLSSPLNLSLINPSAVGSNAISISDGEYRLEEVTLNNPTLTDINPVPPGTCLDGVLSSPRTAGRLPPPEVNQAVINSRIRLGPFNPPVTFVVPRLGERAVRMLIDAPALIALYEAAFTCRSTGSCGGAAPAPCMSAFTPIPPAQATQVFSFE